MSTLHDQLLAAHARGDARTLAGLYRQAALNAPDSDAAAFYMTHAYVFALESGDPQVTRIRDWLVQEGREPPA